MESFVFECAHCKQSIEAEESMRGEVVRCPNCGKGIVVPKRKPMTLRHPSLHEHSVVRDEQNRSSAAGGIPASGDAACGSPVGYVSEYERQKMQVQRENRISRSTAYVTTTIMFALKSVVLLGVVIVGIIWWRSLNRQGEVNDGKMGGQEIDASGRAVGTAGDSVDDAARAQVHVPEKGKESSGSSEKEIAAASLEKDVHSRHVGRVAPDLDENVEDNDNTVGKREVPANASEDVERQSDEEEERAKKLATRQMYDKAVSGFQMAEYSFWKDAPSVDRPREVKEETIFYVLIPRTEMEYEIYELNIAPGAEMKVLRLYPDQEADEISEKAFMGLMSTGPYVIRRENRAYLCSTQNQEEIRFLRAGRYLDPFKHELGMLYDVMRNGLSISNLPLLYEVVFVPKGGKDKIQIGKVVYGRTLSYHTLRNKVMDWLREKRTKQSGIGPDRIRQESSIDDSSLCDIVLSGGSVKLIGCSSLDLLESSGKNMVFNDDHDEEAVSDNDLASSIEELKGKISAKRKEWKRLKDINPAVEFTRSQSSITNVDRRKLSRGKYYNGGCVFVRRMFYCTMCSREHTMPCKKSVASFGRWHQLYEKVAETTEINARIDEVVAEIESLERKLAGLTKRLKKSH